MSDRTWRFGPFALETATRRLLCDGREVHLSPKAFDLLRLLIEDRNRAVPRSELHQQLWPSTFVLETSLASLIAEIRRALDDSADEPRYVRTVNRVGYWFIASIVDDEAPASSPPAPRYWLIWESRQVALMNGENIIGRGQDATIWLDAAGVSRYHAKIMAADSPTLEDLGSKNGTFLGGEPVTGPHPLTDGDEIRLGSIVVTFRVPAPGGSTETTPRK